MSTTRTPTELSPPAIDDVDEGDRPSITDVNGTVARFEMAYNPAPEERFVFGPPVWQRLPSLVFVGFAAVLGIVTVLAHHSAHESELYRFVVVGNRTPFAILVGFAAIATFLRSGMLGVIVTREGVETRTLALGIPRVKKHRWPQIDRVVLDGESVLFELWNGTYERLPRVGDAAGLVDLLERVATGKGRQITRLAPGRLPRR